MAQRDAAAEQLEEWRKKNENKIGYASNNSGIGIVNPKTSLTIGKYGLIPLRDWQMMEHLSHFHRERIPERIVHAKGSGAFGYFKCIKALGSYTSSKVFEAVGKETPIAVRFSTVAGNLGSADTVRDPRDVNASNNFSWHDHVVALATTASQKLGLLFRAKRKNFSEGSESDRVEEVEEHFNLEEKSAIINGGASGIGLEIAREFLKKGVPHLSIIDIDEKRGEQVVMDLSEEFGRDKILFFEADVADAMALDNVYRKSIQFHDTPDIIVNSAGIMNDTKWEKQICTNITGCVVGTLLGMQYMSKSSNGYGGIIVNVGSILGIIPSSGYPLHTMTQFGVCGFSKALGCGNHIHRTGVKVFAICPGLTDTRLLSEAPSGAINDRFAQEFADEIDGSSPQKASSVAKGLVDILDKAKPGSVWVVENDGRPFEVTYPGNVLDMKKEKQKRTIVAS